MEALIVIAISLLVVTVLIGLFLLAVYIIMRQLNISSGVDITDKEIWDNPKGFSLWLTGFPDAAKRENNKTK